MEEAFGTEIKKPIPEPELDPVLDQELIPSPEVNDDLEEEEEFLQAIFDINEIIELLKQGKVDSLESIKACLLNVGVILEYFQKNYQWV